MPAPRAVLHDILELNLDPTQHHRRISSDGRLARPATPEQELHGTDVTHPTEVLSIVEAVNEKLPTESALDAEDASTTVKKWRGKKAAAADTQG